MQALSKIRSVRENSGFLLIAWLLGLLGNLFLGPGLPVAQAAPLEPAEAPRVGPELSIPAMIPALPNSTVSIPVTFNAHGNNIASAIFSIDIDNTWLSLDPSIPFSLTLTLPLGFVGGCWADPGDSDGEIDCWVMDPTEPILSLPDGVIASLTLATGNAPDGTVAPVTFSPEPPVSFGTTYGGSIPGAATPGSVLFYIPPPPPDPPSDLVGIYYWCGQVDLDWTDNSNNEDGFRIERSDDGFSGWTLVGETAPNVRHFSYLLPPGSPSQHYFRVYAFNSTGDSPFSGVAAVSTTGSCLYGVFIPALGYGFGGGTSISGRVIDNMGAGMAAAVVADTVKGLSTLTDADGYYTLSGLTAGNYDVMAYKDGYECTPGFTNPVAVPPEATGKDFTCVSVGYTISGVVTGPYGLPLAGAVVSDPSKGYSTLTNLSGAYTLSGLPAGAYNLAAYKEGYFCTASFSSPVNVPPSATARNFTCYVMPTCSDLVVNGSFEARTAWEIPITEYTAGYSTARAYTGTSSMRTGITNPYDNRYSYSSARQLVTIPADAVSAVLRFFRFPISTSLVMGQSPGAEGLRSVTGLPSLRLLGSPFELSPLSGSDIQLVLILNSSNTILGTLMWDLSNAQAWQYREYNLIAYRGSTIKLYFGAYNDGWGAVTAMFVDNVSLEVCR